MEAKSSSAENVVAVLLLDSRADSSEFGDDSDIPKYCGNVTELSPLGEQTSAKRPQETTQEGTVHSPETDDVNDVSPKSSREKARRLFLHLCTKSALTFSLAAALCLLTQINLAVFFVTQVTTLERQFGFTSAQSGQLLAANEIGYLSLALPASHLASRLHVPRAMFVTALVLGLSGAMCGLPHFLFRESHVNPNASATKSAVKIPPAFCVHGNVTAESLEQSKRCQSEVSITNGTSLAHLSEGLVYNEAAYPVLVYIMVFQVIRGMIGSPRMAMTTTYLDNNCKKSDTGYYIGILAAVAMLGPAIAFIGGGAISKIHVSLRPTSLTPEHPDWVGAWWLGFLVFGLLSAVAPLPLLSFPRSLSSGPRRVESSSKGKARPLTGPGVLRGAFGEVREFVRSLAGLATNPVFLCIVLSSCFVSFAMNGTYRFMPKYLQEQFQLPPWKANFIMGGAELVAGTSGFFVGGLLTRRLKPSLLGLFKIMIALLFASILLVCVQLAVGCPEPTLFGEPGKEISGDSNISACVASCSCPDEVAPVCGDGASYFSPCHAGCSQQTDGVYENCTCVPSGRATPGLCQSECTSVYPFAVIFYVLLFLLSVLGPPSFLQILRSVPEHQKALAVGTNGFASSLCGFLIGPLVYGRLIDTFCQHWRSPCGTRGACSVYNLQSFRINLHLYTVVSMVLSLVLQVAGLLILTFGGRFVPPGVLHGGSQQAPEPGGAASSGNGGGAAIDKDYVTCSDRRSPKDSRTTEESREMLPNASGENL